MFYVYKLINKINNKIYIGVHETDNFNDKYMGSGSLIKKAIKKYGIQSFDKRMLYRTEYKEMAYKLENLLVTKQFINSDKTYNLCIGGYSCWGFPYFSDKLKEKIKQRMKIDNPAFNMSDQTKKLMSDAHKGKPSNAKGHFKIKGDDRFIGCSLKGENNPRAKHFNIYDSNDNLIFECKGNFHKTLKDNDMPSGLFRKSASNNGEKISLPKRARKYLREKHKKYIGWYAKEIK